MPDVEFLTGDDPGSDEGELLDTGPRRSVPRWVWVVGLLALTAVIVAVVVTQGGGGSPAPVAGSSTPAPSASLSVENLLPNLPLADAYDLVGDDRDFRLFAMSGSQLFALAPDGQPIGSGVAVQVGNVADSQVELILDPANHVLWAVPQNATGHDGLAAGFAEPFDTRTLHAYGRIPLPGRVEGAATLDGTLYVSTDAGMWRTTTPGGPFEQVAGSAVADAQLVTDQAHGRLLCVLSAARTTVRSYRPATRLSAPVRLPSATAVLTTVGRTIWLIGTSGGRPLLATLDPRTLGVGRNVAPGRGDVELQGTGNRSLYVSVGDTLRCLSGTTGRQLHDFGHLRGEFASVAGHGFVGTIEALHPIAMGRCPG